jgi:hypothetical protein
VVSVYKYKYKYKYHDRLPHHTQPISSRGLMQSEQPQLHQQVPENAIFLKKITSRRKGDCDLFCPNCKRSSDNFSLSDEVRNIPGSFTFWFDIMGNVDRNKVEFDICEDILWGVDQKVYSNLRRGDFAFFEKRNQLYISNPRNASAVFDIYIYAVPK